MAFDLAPRLKPIKPTYLSPSYYTVFVVPDVKPHCAPFLSGSRRTLHQKPWTEALYNIHQPTRIIGGSSMQNRSKRETIVNQTEGPSATTYNLSGSNSGSVSRRRPRKLYVCRLPYSSEAKGPSVPARIDENGYSLDVNNMLIKNPPDNHDNTLGPAYYCIKDPQCSFNSKMLYGGCRWSASKTQRKTFETATDFPGPGSYDIGAQRSCPVQESYDEYREMARAFSFLPRYLERLQTHARDENLPGPANYNIQSPLKTKTTNTKGPFCNSSPRFRCGVEQTPGPGDYGHKSFVETSKVSRAEGSFTFQEDRFPAHKRKPGEAPSPASYSINRDLLRKPSVKYKIAPFGSTCARDAFGADEERPGPGDYDPERTSSCRNQYRTSAFSSRVRRDPFGGKRESLNWANVGTYNIRDTYDKVHNPTCHRAFQVAFFTNEPRKWMENIDVQRPGPAEYMAHAMMPFKGCAFAKYARFGSQDRVGPGPDAYHISPEYGSSMMKANRTWNLRLKENACRTKLRVPPNKTREHWMVEKNKRKVLNVFE